MTFGERRTVGDYNCAEVASALQKCVRRGLEDDALYWATELDMSGFGEYVWKRLRIIASEDIGEACPFAAVQIRALYGNWIDQRKKADTKHAPERLFLVHAVSVLCRSAKSRYVDHALIVHYEGERDGRPIPDFALDMHTSRGRGLKRGAAHFFAEGARCSPSAGHVDRYAEQARAIRSAPRRAADPPQSELDL